MRLIHQFSRWLMAVSSLLWLQLLGRMPVPSDSKWRGTSEFLSLICAAMLEDEESQAFHSRRALSKAMDRTGRLWMGTRSQWLRSSVARTSGLNDLFNLTFKTLDMQTVVQHEGPKIRTITFQCPFVLRAKNDTTARLTCDLVCAEHLSLFHGLVKGLPFYLTYLAPQRMGWGDPYCVKEFETFTPEASLPKQAHPVAPV